MIVRWNSWPPCKRWRTNSWHLVLIGTPSCACMWALKLVWQALLALFHCLTSLDMFSHQHQLFVSCSPPGGDAMTEHVSLSFKQDAFNSRDWMLCRNAYNDCLWWQHFSMDRSTLATSWTTRQKRMQERMPHFYTFLICGTSMMFCKFKSRGPESVASTILSRQAGTFDTTGFDRLVTEMQLEALVVFVAVCCTLLISFHKMSSRLGNTSCHVLLPPVNQSVVSVSTYT